MINLAKCHKDTKTPGFAKVSLHSLRFLGPLCAHSFSRRKEYAKNRWGRKDAWSTQCTSAPFVASLRGAGCKNAK